MQKMKRNHWVPQSYLRPFAADPETREKIWRFGKTQGDPEMKPIEKVAVKFYLYAPMSDAGVRDYTFEQKLSDLENWFGDDLWIRLGQELMPLQWEPLRKMVSLLAAVMYLRNPAQLDHAKELHRRIVETYEQLPSLPTQLEYEGKTYNFDTSNWPAYRDAGEEELKRLWIDSVSSCTWLAEMLMKMRWSIVFSDSPVFITSDHPVTITHPSLEFRGLRNPQTSVLFPLSPTRLIVMDNLHHEPANQHYPLKADPAAYNFTLWRNANEYMLCHRHPDLVLQD